MIINFKKMMELLSHKERLYLFFIFLSLILMAFIEMAGIASIMPFMAMIANPEVIETNRWLKNTYAYFDFKDERDFLVFLGVVVLFLLIFSNLSKAFITWITLRFDNNLYYMLSKRLLFRYLHRPYSFFLDRNTSEMGKNILEEVRRVIISVLSPCVRILAGSLIVTFILVLLVVVDPLVAISIAMTLGSIYFFIYLAVRKVLSRIGQEQVQAAAMKFKTAGDALGGIKDIKILGCEMVFLERFSFHAKKHADNNVSAELIGQLPRYALEVLAFGGILIIVLYFLKADQGAEKIVPLMALYAFAGYRLLPALQQVFSSTATLRSGLATLELLHGDMIEDQCTLKTEFLPICSQSQIALPCNRAIVLKAVSFCYPASHKLALQDINLSIAANTTVGFVGSTGSGKTTIIDILLGLLPPRTGELFVDGVEINDQTLARWQLNLGYVPQSIYLADDTLTRNIAFGVTDSQIAMDAVVRAARIANLSDFINQELPEGYETIIGERGIRLSGGQRQRIGIARALYRDPSVLIMDEATSALDGLTEKSVIDAISNLSRKKTIIMIAHRLSTVRGCDVIFVLEHGRVVAQGNFDSLSHSSKWFRDVAGYKSMESTKPSKS